MLSLRVRRFIWVGCLLCIVFTMYYKSSIHPTTDPAWLQNSGELPAPDQEPIVILHYHERRPYYITTWTKVQGLVAGTVARAFEFAEIPYKWQQTPAKRQLDLIRNNDSLSCGVGWFKTAERQKFGKFSNPIYQDSPFVAVAMAENTLIQSMLTLDQLLGEHRLKLLVKAGYSYGTDVDSKIRELLPWKVETTADNQDMLRMLEGHRADYCFMTKEEATDLFMHAGFNKDKFIMVPFAAIPNGNKRYLICSQQVPDEIIERFNLAVDFLQKNGRRTK